MVEQNKEENEEEIMPPFFKSWTGMYLLVLGNLVFMILLFYLFTSFYR